MRNGLTLPVQGIFGTAKLFHFKSTYLYNLIGAQLIDYSYFGSFLEKVINLLFRGKGLELLGLVSHRSRVRIPVRGVTSVATGQVGPLFIVIIIIE